ncbi:MAG: ABC transporter ATP-binding protein [SAR202 cluster bacterium]|nr:ABC transporter ATP-binding protein [SAR202 cluster bacterium]
MKILYRAAAYGFRHKLLITGSYASTFSATFLGLLTPLLLGSSIDSVIDSGVSSRLWLYGGAVLLVAFLRSMSTYAQSFLSEAVSQRAAFDIRNDFFRKLQHLSFGFYDKHQTGNLMSRATSDIENIRGWASGGLLQIFTITFTVISVSAILFTTNWKLTLVSLSVTPIVGRLFGKGMPKRLNDMWHKVQVETGHMTTVLQENLTGMRVVKAFGGRQFEQAKFKDKSVIVADETYHANALQISRGAIMTFVYTGVTGALLLVGGMEVADGRLTPGELATFLLMTNQILNPVRQLSGVITNVSRTMAAGNRVFEILDAISPVEEKKNAIVLPRAKGKVKFDHVSLSYDGKAAALDDIDFEVEPGQLVAILGGPGAGKSSLVHLIPRFYDATKGRITVDGTDIRDVTLNSLRTNVGIVQQDVFMFAATIKENIAYGLEGASMDDIERASKIAQLHNYIMTLPHDYDTWVGERGITLSGGQRQRLAIARTVLLDPPILVLDDSTASVDAHTEALIQQALGEVVNGRTTFVIAHRLSSIRRANLVLVLEHGKIVERGTHQELMALGGFYRKIYDLQFRPQEEKAAQNPAVH